MISETLLKQGDLQAALAELQTQIRTKPSDSALRIFLFQLLAVMGEWQRALAQLKVIAKLDDSALAMVHMYRSAIECELFREQVFQGQREPVFFGQPKAWQALMLQALKLSSEGQQVKAQAIREDAFEQAETTSGVLNEKPFAWIADADMRLGPMLELYLEGRYFWVPFSAIQTIDIEAPEDLRDMIWSPVHIRWVTEGESYALIPTRYPFSAQHDDAALALARKTVWQDCGHEEYQGFGQRVFTTDDNDYPLLDIRSIHFNQG